MNKTLANKIIGILIILLIVIITAVSTVLIRVIAGEKCDFKFTVMSDICVMANELLGDQNNEEFKKFSDDKISFIRLSEGIFASAVTEFIESDSNILFLTGGLTADGSLVSHKAVVKQLNRIKDAKKKVFVINGESDTGVFGAAYDYSVKPAIPVDVATIADFAELYADFGYGASSNRDPNSLSYVCDLSGNYSLVALDFCSEAALNSDGEVLDSIVLWSEEPIKEIRKRGRIPIGLTHMPVVQHLGKAVESFKISGTSIKSKEVTGSSLLYAGMNILFVGHLHAQDVAAFTVTDINNGNFYEVETASISAYPSVYREVEVFGEKLRITTRHLEKINPSYFGSKVPESLISAMQTDYHAFIYEYMTSKMYGFLENAVSLDDIFQLDEKSNEDENRKQAIAEIYNGLIAHLKEFYELPLKKSDAAEGGNSLEKLAGMYGRSFPELKYKTMGELLLSPVRANFEGDENIGENELYGIELAFYALFYYLADFNPIGKLHDIEPSIPDINISNCLDRLFTDGILSTRDDEILLKLISIPAIKDMEVISMFVRDVTSEEDAFNRLYTVLKRFEVYGMDLSQFMNPDECEIDVGKLIYEGVYGNLASDFISDFGVSDNNIEIDLENASWRNLEIE